VVVNLDITNGSQMMIDLYHSGIPWFRALFKEVIKEILVPYKVSIRNSDLIPCHGIDLRMMEKSFEGLVKERKDPPSKHIGNQNLHLMLAKG